MITKAFTDCQKSKANKQHYKQALARYLQFDKRVAIEK